MTQAQLKAQIYNAIIGDATLNGYLQNRIQWLLKPTTDQEYPLMTYQILDTVGSYVHGGTVIESHEKVDVQIDIYSSSITQMDALFTNLKRVMHSIGYMQGGGGEFIEGNMIIRATRWAVQNV